MPATDASLIDFARTNDAVAATAKKLEKYAILAEYFRRLNEDDLRRAVRFAGGRTFALTDERVLAVGGAIVSDVIIRLLQIEGSLLYETAVASGEMGEALAKLWHHPPPLARGEPGRPAVSPDPVTLADLEQAFEALASTGNVRRKGEILTELFSRCTDGREAAYLAKIIFGDLRTGVQEGVLIDAIARAFGRERKQVQRAVLLVGDLGEVAVLAKHDRLADARFTLFHPIQFMLATAQEDAAEAARTLAGRAFFAEDKLDGIRAQVHKQGERIAIYTRTMDRTDESFPDVVEAMRALPGDFLLDGEIVPFRDGKVLPFAHIQKRLGRKVPTSRIIRENPAAFIAFDILYRDGEVLMDRPLRERRRSLEDLTKPCCAAVEGLSVGATPASRRGAAANPPQDEDSTLRADVARASPLLSNVTTVTAEEEINRAFCLARDCRNEGLVLKDPDSLYSPGRRGKAWLKLKTHLPTFDCVVTYAETGHGKRRGSLSDYTFAVWDREPDEQGAELVNVGKAYSGVTDAEIAQLTELFTSITRRVYDGRVREVEPKVVLEIACDQIQKSARHASGFAMRFPRIKRIRWDKKPMDADRLARVIEVYHSVANFGRGDGEPPAPAPAEPTLFDGLM